MKSISVIVFEILAFKVAYCVAERAVKKKLGAGPYCFWGNLVVKELSI